MPGIHCEALRALPQIRAGDDLAALIAAVLPDDLGDVDLVAVAHKVVSKAEGRTRRLAEVEPGERARALGAERDRDPRLVQAVLDESVELLSVRGPLICVTRHGFVCANAGVDRSNAAGEDELILLPEDPDATARRLRDGIEAARGVRPAVIVTDSFGRAWRTGQVDVAIGVAGLSPVDTWAGRPDAFGRELHATSIAVADGAAAAADLARAKDSSQPVVLVRGLGRYVTPEDGPGAAPLRRAPEDDLFR
jgi:coenzyme F420-0:L-glutamate ligase/coenzyme F420-1:gamma-L-glutamate ligase